MASSPITSAPASCYKVHSFEATTGAFLDHSRSSPDPKIRYNRFAQRQGEFEPAALQIDGFLNLISNESGEYVCLLDGTLYSNVPDSRVEEMLTQALRKLALDRNSRKKAKKAQKKGRKHHR
jgi:hypothetical protein